MSASATAMPLRAYADGGCIGINPSPDGGTWAFRLIGFGEVILAERSGIVLPAEAGLPTISNNYTELLACLRALQSLPDGWEGVLHTDSQVTLLRLTRDRPSFNGIPEEMVEETWRQRKRMGKLTLVLLDGHPTRAHLLAGVGKRGYPVSEHNVACDKACTRQSVEFLKRKHSKP